MITEIEGTCQYEGCNEPATDIACGRFSLNYDSYKKHPEPNLYCLEHAYKVEAEVDPEYVTACPNCGCHFGVN